MKRPTRHTHHIIPKHMGGTDHPDNLVELTPMEHADAHSLLYALYKNPMDKRMEALLLNEEKRYANWATEETRNKMSQARKGIDPWNKGKQTGQVVWNKGKTGIPAGRQDDFVLTTPEGNDLEITNLRKFCRENDLNYKCMREVVAGNQRQHRGWKARRVVS